MNSKHIKPASRALLVRRTALAAAIAMGAGLSGQVFAQATTGSIFGTAPVASGEMVRILDNQTGLTREVPVSSSGQYSATDLPVGNDYTVSLLSGDGAVLASQDHVPVSVNGGTQVPFASAAAGKNVQTMAGVTVTANAIPAIDVSSTRETSVITAADLKVLPIGRNAESIALLAPGVAGGNSELGKGPAGTPLISFGGDSVVENAYYINGFNTTDPVGNAGGIALPYFAIAEQQTITSGYGAQYGRSTGGVISQIGKSGGNQFHAGIYATWAPSWAQGDFKNTHYMNPASTTPGEEYGDVYQNERHNSNWSTIYDAYVSGPLIKDKLFFYLTGEVEHDTTRGTSLGGGNFLSNGTSLPKFYGKLNWNINDNNTLELTGIQTKNEDQYYNIYDYNNNDGKVGAFNAIDNPLYASKFDIGILKYTSYITDNLTLTVLGGKMKSTYYSQSMSYPGYDASVAAIAGGSQAVATQNPDVPGYGLYNNNPGTVPVPGHKSSSNNLRINLDWKLGNHDLSFGIDNQRSEDVDDGSVDTGPGYYWSYGQSTASPLVCNGQHQCAGTAVTPTNPKGYYVDKVVYGATASFAVMQKAQYIQDNWQVTPNLLLNLGVRNDQFTNYNGVGVPYIKMTKPQWAPRLGFSWDIFGDSTAKLYGNVGRYYLALPSGLGVRMAGSNAYLDTYYTYTSIGPYGEPQGLQEVNPMPSPYSADGEYGTPKDPRVIAAANLKPMYQDEYVLGFQKLFHAFGEPLVWTSQATWSKMRDIVDDTGSIVLPANAAASEAGAETDVLVNPGRSETMRYLTNAGTYATYTWNPHTASDGTVMGFPPAFRNYYSLEESLAHPWDGKWMGKIDYVFSRSWGTTEGPTFSPNGQITVASGASAGNSGGQSGSITQTWDYPSLMQYSNGDLPNMHKHTLKAYGTYAITPQWLVSGMVIIQSGAPITCLGAYGPGESDPVGYMLPTFPGAYHWCEGKPSPPGAIGSLPWTHQINLGVTYIPAWAGKHLSLQLQVYNLLNEQKTTAVQAATGAKGAPWGLYMSPYSTELPRYAQFSVKYDW